MRTITRTIPAAVLAAALVLGCSVKTEDLSYTDPEWREKVNREVTFPLPEPVTLTMEIEGASDMNNPSRAWLKRKTNITLRYVSIPTSPGDIELGSMMRAGNLPDIISEQRLGSLLLYNEHLFADFLEFPGLTPNFDALLAADPGFLTGTATRVNDNGTMTSPGVYDPAKIRYAGSIHYRKDLFDALDLEFSTWDELLESFRILKERFPGSYPFGISSDFVYYAAPSWFGSGLDRRNILYYDADAGEWKAGPQDPEFREYVEFFRALYTEGLAHPDMMVNRDDMSRGWFMSETIFAAPSLQASGPMYAGFFDDYGNLGPDGEWDGTGKWITSMPIPAPRSGARVTASPGLRSSVEPGWCVYTQSDHVGEAIALLDFLFTTEAALISEYGPEGILWTYGDGGEPRLIPEIKSPYNPDGTRSIEEYLRAASLTVGFPLRGLVFDDRRLLGLDLRPEYRHYVSRDVPASPIVLNPGITYGRAPDFGDKTADIRVSLDTAITSGVAQFISGKRPMEEYDAFVAGLDRYGLSKLLDLYRESTSTIGLEKLKERIKGK